MKKLNLSKLSQKAKEHPRLSWALLAGIFSFSIVAIKPQIFGSLVKKDDSQHIINVPNLEIGTNLGHVEQKIIIHNNTFDLDEFDLDEFTDKVTLPYKEQVDSLKQQISRLEDKVKDKKRLNQQLWDLSKKLTTAEQQLAEKEQKIKEMWEKFKNQDLNAMDRQYQQAFKLFSEGHLQEAIALLDEKQLSKQEEQLSKQEEQLSKQKKHLAEKRLLKARALQLTNQFDLAAQNYEKALTLQANFDNALEVGNLYYTLNQFQQAEVHYQTALKLASSKDEKAGVLFTRCSNNFK